jgi:hypothetical protein
VILQPRVVCVCQCRRDLEICDRRDRDLPHWPPIGSGVLPEGRALRQGPLAVHEIWQVLAIMVKLLFGVPPVGNRTIGAGIKKSFQRSLPSFL